MDEAVLKAVHTLGYDQPTDDQKDAIRSFLSRKDVFVSLPMGSGKSLCFASLPIVFDLLRTSAGQKSTVVAMMYNIN